MIRRARAGVCSFLLVYLRYIVQNFGRNGFVANYGAVYALTISEIGHDFSSHVLQLVAAQVQTSLLVSPLQPVPSPVP